MEIEKAYGAKGTIYLQSNLDMEELCQYLNTKLGISMSTDTDMDPPHTLFAYNAGEGGIEYSLYYNDTIKREDYQYEFRLMTGELEFEQLHKRVYDLSLWFARLVALACEIKTLAVRSVGKAGQVYSYDDKILKVTCNIETL